MYKLIPLSVLLLCSSCYSSGHHRGEADIELSTPIMRFLSKLKDSDALEVDSFYLTDPCEEITPLRRLSISINEYLERSVEVVHNNSPVDVIIYNPPVERTRKNVKRARR
jgi:hypothetical protein